jgi:hypothetical protein
MTITIESVDRNAVRTLLEAARKALTIVAEDHGVELLRKHCSYSSTEIPVAFKFVVVERTEDGEAIDPRETEFRKFAALYGLEPDDYGKMFKTFNGVYRVCGVKPRGKKYNILGESITNGKTYKFRIDTVKDGLKAQDST